MANEMLARLRHPKEDGYGIVMLILGIIFWVFFAISMIAAIFIQPAEVIVYLVYGGGFALFIYISAALYRAHIYGHYILLSPAQFPRLYDMVQEGAANIGLSPAPTAFLYNSNGLINAFARRLVGGRYIFLTSGLVEADTDEQVKFVIGHELGHHAAGHLNWFKNLLKLPAHLIPFLASAYSRSRELTCDRIGAYLSNDMNASRTALQMLACGCRRLNTSLNCEAFEAQEKLVPAFWGWVSLIFARYPRTTQRVIAVSAFFNESTTQAYPPPNSTRRAPDPQGWNPA